MSRVPACATVCLLAVLVVDWFPDGRAFLAVGIVAATGMAVGAWLTRTTIEAEQEQRQALAARVARARRLELEPAGDGATFRVLPDDPGFDVAGDL